MKIDIIEEPIRFHLHGIGGTVQDERYGEVGLRLMNELWPAVKKAGLATTGINHWVYLDDHKMAVAVELKNPAQPNVPTPLESIEFELPRYLKHVHIGPYQTLPQKWKALKADLATHSEIIGSPSMEIYGHHSDDPSKTETTILIGLQPRPNASAKTIDRNVFASLYTGQPAWEIGRPQQCFLNAADRIKGSILDSGCGTGENAFYFAGRGHTVTGFDFLAEPIAIAKQKAAERNLPVTFLVKDALSLKEWDQRFDNVIDSGLFHVFNDADRRTYVDGLATVLKPDGHFFVVCFSDAEPGTQGPRRVTRKEIEETFAKGWVIESIEPTHFEVRPDSNDMRFSDGGPKAWFVVARKAG